MRIPLFQVDAFASRPFQGNPAAVCPLEAWLPDETLLGIAAENNLSETAFTVPRADGSYDLRWFTPTVEVDLCGHATLAAAHVMIGSAKQIAFHTRSGELGVARDEGRLVLDMPSIPPGAPITNERVASALGVAPLALYPLRELHHATYLLALYENEAAVASLRGLSLPDVNVCCTAPADAAELDFVSRFFAPGSGVPEDPVTGSTHASLTPFWADRLGKDTLRARQISKRGGDLRCQLVGGPAGRVRVAGTAVTVIEGTFLLAL